MAKRKQFSRCPQQNTNPAARHPNTTGRRGWNKPGPGGGKPVFSESADPGKAGFYCYFPISPDAVKNVPYPKPLSQIQEFGAMTTVGLRTFAIILLLWVLPADGQDASPNNVARDVESKRAAFDTGIDGRHDIEVVSMSPAIVLKGAVNGRPANVLFDTGSWPNGIDSHFESELSGPVESVLAGGKLVDVCNWQNLTVGGFRSADSGKVALADLSPLSRTVGTEIDALAGTPFAFRRVFEIDFVNRRFRLTDEPPNTHEIVVDIEFDVLGRPWVELAIGNCKEEFLVDTGFDGFVAVSESMAKALEEGGFAQKKGEIDGLAFSDGFTTQSGVSMVLQEQGLFGYQFRNLPIYVLPGNSKNKIGLELLGAFDLTLDLRQGKLGLNKNSRFALADGCTVNPTK